MQDEEKIIVKKKARHARAALNENSKSFSFPLILAIKYFMQSRVHFSPFFPQVNFELSHSKPVVLELIQKNS
jgi:hypothetical protein